MRIDRTTIGGSIATLAMIAATSGKVYIGGFLMALGMGVLYERKKK